MQWLEWDGVPILLDAAHNPSGMEKVCEQMRIQMERDASPTPGVILLGCTPQADLVGFLHPLTELIVEGEVEYIVVTEPQKGRRKAVRASEVANELEAQGVPAKVEQFPEPAAGLARAVELASGDPVQPVLVIGSIYLVGNLLNELGQGSTEAMTTLRPTPEKSYWT
jgi:folylpolyglutamate synthase/dihydropteroate synthase